MKKVVLAYSGGLDTSCIIPWMKDKGYQTIAFIADVGQGDDFERIKKRALQSGASKVHCLNLQKEFVTDYCLKGLLILIEANILILILIFARMAAPM